MSSVRSCAASDGRWRDAAADIIVATEGIRMLTMDEAKERLQGVVVPIATIFTDDGAVDLDGLASNVQWLIDQGARQGNTVLLAAGSGGDFTVLSTEERRQVIQTIVDVSGGRVPVMAGVQSTDIRVVIELCQFCEDLGVDAAQISAAYYYTVTPEDAVAWHVEVARHTNVGFAAYSHWYSGSKYDVPVDLMAELVELPNTIAVKWGSPDMGSHLEGLRRFVPLAAVVDNSPLVVLGHILGCRGWISHVPNFLPQHSWRVCDLMQAREYEEAQRVFDDFMVPYGEIIGGIGAQTAGEGVFVKPWMAAMGLPGRRLAAAVAGRRRNARNARKDSLDSGPAARGGAGLGCSGGPRCVQRGTETSVEPFRLPGCPQAGPPCITMSCRPWGDAFKRGH